MLALFNWDTGAKIVEATILAGTPTEETGSFDSHFVDIPDVVLSPGTDYLVAVEVGPFDATYDATGKFYLHVTRRDQQGRGPLLRRSDSPEMPATADGFTGSYPGDSYYGPNFKIELPPPSGLTLQVATNTGALTLLNDTAAAIDFNFYQITSGLDSLDSVNWKSLEDQDLPAFPAGDGTGNGWEESGGVGTHSLAEGFLQDNSTLNPSESVSLGKGYDVSVDAQDLVFKFRPTADKLSTESSSMSPP